MSILKVFAYAVVLIVLAFFLILLSHVFGVIGTIATAPGRVLNRTLATDNIVQNYELFQDLYAGYQSRAAQVGDLKDGPMDSEYDRTDLLAVKQSCRNIVSEYNANSEKINRNIFKRRSNLPYRLELSDCE